MSDKEDRIAKLSQRFKQHSTGRPKVITKSRERQSFYLDTALTEQIDKTYKDVSYQLYPKPISKSVFLETLLEYGLDNIDTVKSRLSEVEEAGGELITLPYLRHLTHILHISTVIHVTHVVHLR